MENKITYSCLTISTYGGKVVFDRPQGVAKGKLGEVILFVGVDEEKNEIQYCELVPVDGEKIVPEVYYKMENKKVKEAYKLNPCPFCGGEADFLPSNYDTYYLLCRKCSKKVGLYVGGYKTMEQAADAWNGRQLEREGDV